jgi:arylsulfatase A-like enzyme
MVDRWFGRVLGVLDDQNAWNETIVVVTSDHGHYLGDHGWMGKPFSTVYDTLAHTPLLIWHPESDQMGGRISSVTAAVDVYATLLDALDAEIPENVHSRSLMPILRGKTERVRDWALYGYWGSSVNVTDGDYTYHCPARMDVEAGIYSTMMLNEYPRVLDPPPARTDVDAGQYLPYTDVPVWRVMEQPHSPRGDAPELYDVDADPDQQEDLVGSDGAAEIEDRMCELMIEALDALLKMEDGEGITPK